MASRPYPNIKAELARNGVSQKAVSEHFNLAQNTIYNKINGRTSLTVDELVEMRDVFMPDATLDYLAER